MMNNVYCLLFGLFLSITIQAQQGNVVDKFISNHLDDEKTIVMSFPGWLFQSSFKLASRMQDDEEFKDFTKLTKHVKNIRVLATKEDQSIPKNELLALTNNMRQQAGYEEYIRVRSDGSNVDLFAIESDEVIKRMVFFINDDGNLILIRLKTDLPIELFADLNYKLQ